MGPTLLPKIEIFLQAAQPWLITIVAGPSPTLTSHQSQPCPLQVVGFDCQFGYDAVYLRSLALNVT